MSSHCTLPTAVSDVCDEIERAAAKHPPYNSPHEASSVLWEEFEEHREHVRANTGNSRDAYEELMQVAAVAIREMQNIMRRTNYRPITAYQIQRERKLKREIGR